MHLASGGVKLHQCGDVDPLVARRSEGIGKRLI